MKVKLAALKTAFAAVRHAISAPDTSRMAIHGLRLEVGKEGGLQLVATDGKRLATTWVGQPTNECVSSSIVDVKSFAKTLRELPVSVTELVDEVDVSVGGEVVRLNEKEVAVIDGSWPDWRSVIPKPNAGSGYIVKDTAGLAKILREACDRLAAREAESRRLRAPVRAEAKAKLNAARAALKALKLEQSTERKAYKDKIAAATTKEEKKALRVERDTKYAEKKSVIASAHEENLRLAKATEDDGSWPVQPVARMSIEANKWRFGIRDGAAPGSVAELEVVFENATSGDKLEKYGVNPMYLVETFAAIKGEAEVRLRDSMDALTVRARVKGLEVTCLMMPIYLG